MTRTECDIAPTTVEGSSLTDAGVIRPTNEDSVAVIIPCELEQLCERGVLAVVADGMGGHLGGEIASSIATSLIVECYYSGMGDPQTCLLRAFETANDLIYDYASRKELAGMGTTCTAVVVVNGLAYSAHVGDSRIYLLRGGQIYCMTEDHSATMELVRQGALTVEQARSHDDRNVILRAMGTRRDLKAATWAAPFPMRAGDRFLLCSDGLYEKISDAELASIGCATPLEQACSELIRLAAERLSSDNASVAILHFGAHHD